MDKEFNPANMRVFLAKNFNFNLKPFLRAVFNKETVCYYEGQLDLAEKYYLTDIVVMDISTNICNLYKDWKDLYFVLNKSTEVFKKFN